MTALDGPVLSAMQDWAYGPGDLTDFGIHYSPEQLDLYHSAQHFQSLALLVAFPHDPELQQAVPLFTMDHHDNEQIVSVPAVVNLSPAHREEALTREGSAALRFPSLPGRLLEPTYSREIGPDVNYLKPEFHRLWNLWPINEHQAADVLDGSRLWREANYELLEAYYACERGDMDPCEIVCFNEGIPYDQHQHRHHLDARGDVQIIECADGEEWLHTFKNSSFRLDESGLLVPLPMPDLRLCDDELHLTWEQLRITSQINTYRAMSSISERDRETVLRTERNYSPWLWSS